MVSAASNHALGIGLYTPCQAAYLARVHVETLNRWVHGRGQWQPALRPQLAGDDERTITFLDFVQAMAIRSIRRAKKIPLPKIREFVDLAASEYGIEYPFARKHQTFLFGDDIVLSLPDGTLVQMTGKYKHQDLIRPVVEFYMEDLAFNPEGLAYEYVPLKEAGREIRINPAHRFGQPMVLPCGYSVNALVESVRAEGSIDAAAKVNAVDRGDVLLSLRYDDLLANVAA